MNRGGLLLSFFFASLSLVACSSSRESSGVGGSCANYVAAIRDSAKECGRFNIAPARESDYVGRLEQSCQNALNAPGSGLTPAILDQCASKVREACGDDDACDDLLSDIRGTLADGVACDADYQCASGQCNTDGKSSAPSCGKCAPAVAIGEPCPQGGCAAGASCRVTSTGSSSTSVCVAEKIANAGEPCGSSSSSEESVRCAMGLFCQYESSTSGAPSNGTCQPLLGEGSACGNAASGYARCKAPLACVKGRCGKLLAAGTECEDSGDCQSGLGCDPSTKQCAAIPWGPTGSSCDDNLLRCEHGFCQRVATGGDTGAAGTCVDFIEDGQPCDVKDTERRCDSLSRCINGTCQLQNPAQCQ